jgi:hypothetical protein
MKEAAPSMMFEIDPHTVFRSESEIRQYLIPKTVKVHNYSTGKSRED